MRALTSSRRISAALGFIIAILPLVACSNVTVDREAGANEFLPRPERILVYNFAVTPDEIQLDSIGAEIKSTFEGTPRSEQDTALGHAVANALAKELVSDIQAFGLPAERASGPVPATGNHVVIVGQLLSIDQGSEAERMIIGLGVGSSKVEAHVQVYEHEGSKSVNVETMQADATSGYAPGAAETLGVGGLTGHILVSAAITAASQIGNQELSANVESEARRLADQVSDHLKSLFVAQGWIAAN